MPNLKVKTEVVFKKGQEVIDDDYGEGVIEKVDSSEYPIIVWFYSSGDHRVSYMKDGRSYPAAEITLHINNKK